MIHLRQRVCEREEFARKCISHEGKCKTESKASILGIECKTKKLFYLKQDQVISFDE